MSSTKTQNFILVGIGNYTEPTWNVAVENVLLTTTVFSGGKRHYELVKNKLPKKHTWISIAGSMDEVIENYRNETRTIVIFVSGDPFFYGFGNTLKRLLPNCNLESYPYFSSIQRLCHKTQTNYGAIKTVTLHGRPWDSLDEVLIKEEPLIGVLTDAKHGPNEIAKRLLAYNYNNYNIVIGEELDGEKEKVTSLSLQEAVQYEAAKLNCVLLKRTNAIRAARAFPDCAYETLPGRPGMITKLPIRLISLQKLELEKANVFWDIGSCTGAIAIEAKLKFPHLNCVAFEKRTACKKIIENNTKTFQSPGIKIQIGDFFEQDLSILEKPQAVFIGGHGDRLEELIVEIDKCLAKQGVVVMNTVKEKSFTVFKEKFKTLNYSVEPPLKMAIDAYNTIHVLVAKKEN